MGGNSKTYIYVPGSERVKRNKRLSVYFNIRGRIAKNKKIFCTHFTTYIYVLANGRELKNICICSRVRTC